MNTANYKWPMQHTNCILTKEQRHFSVDLMLCKRNPLLMELQNFRASLGVPSILMNSISQGIIMGERDTVQGDSGGVTATYEAHF
jgi:hypothetical protein